MNHKLLKACTEQARSSIVRKEQIKVVFKSQYIELAGIGTQLNIGIYEGT